MERDQLSTSYPTLKSYKYCIRNDVLWSTPDQLFEFINNDATHILSPYSHMSVNLFVLE